MIDIKLENSEIIEKGLIALGGKLRKNKKKISSKVLKPSAKVVEKVMKSYAPVMTKYKAFNVYRTPKLNSGMRAPKGMGKIYVSIKPRQLRNSIGSFQTKAAKNSPYNSWKDVVAAYKANPKSVKMAGGSVRGSMDHLIGALAFQAAGANPNDVIYVPYDAGGKALAGLLSGETQIISTGLGELMGARDQVRIIGITAPARVSDAPNAPTLKEQGYDVQFVNWRGFFGPPGMSGSMKNEIAKMLGDVQKTPEWETVRARNAWVNIYNPGDKFVSFLEKQTEEMTALMKKLGVI